MKVFFRILGSTNSNLPFSLNFLHSFIFQLYSRWEVIRHDLVVTYLFFLAKLMTSRMDVIQSLICVVRKWSLITNLFYIPKNVLMSHSKHYLCKIVSNGCVFFPKFKPKYIFWEKIKAQKMLSSSMIHCTKSFENKICFERILFYI